MPSFRMPVVLRANYPHANYPHANSPNANCPSTIYIDVYIYIYILLVTLHNVNIFYMELIRIKHNIMQKIHT